jgi:hypothetical protein
MSRAGAVGRGLFQAPSLDGFLRVLPPGLGVSLLLLQTVGLSRALGEAPFSAYIRSHTDFPSFLTGARLIASGQAARLYDLAAQEPVQRALVGDALINERGLLPYNHLPFLALALTPFAGAPIETSYAVWLIATLLALGAALALLTGELLAYSTPQPWRQIPLIWAVLGLWGLALGFFPLFNSLLAAQVTAWVLLSGAIALRAFRTGHEGWAGVALAGGLLKPQLLIVPLLVLLVLRRGRALAGFSAVVGGAGLVAVFALGGVGWVPTYLRLLTQVAGADGAGAIQPLLMGNWRGFLGLIAFHFDPAEAPGGAAPWALPLALVLGAIYVLALLAAWRRGGWHPALTGSAAARAWDVRWAATILATLLTSPHLPPYELALWLLPGVLIWRALRAGWGVGGWKGNDERAPPPAPRLPYAGWRMPLLILGYAAGVLALPLILAGVSWIHLGALAMIVGVPLLLALAARLDRVVPAPQAAR